MYIPMYDVSVPISVLESSGEIDRIPPALLSAAKQMSNQEFHDVLFDKDKVSIFYSDGGEWFLWVLSHDASGISFSLDVYSGDETVLHADGSSRGVRLLNSQTTPHLMENPSRRSITQRHVLKFKQYLTQLSRATGIAVPDVDEYLRDNCVNLFLLPLGRYDDGLIWYHDHRGGCYVRKPLDGLHYLATDDDQFRVIWNERGVDMPARSMEEANTIILSLGGK